MTLYSYAFIGVLERKQESYRVFQFLSYSGRKRAFSQDASHKSNTPKDAVSQQQKNMIFERNKLDVELYDFVNGMLNRTLAVMNKEGMTGSESSLWPL